jgi:hypothetical protein
MLLVNRLAPGAVFHKIDQLLPLITVFELECRSQLVQLFKAQIRHRLDKVVVEVV